MNATYNIVVGFLNRFVHKSINLHAWRGGLWVGDGGPAKREYDLLLCFQCVAVVSSLFYSMHFHK